MGLLGPGSGWGGGVSQVRLLGAVKAQECPQGPDIWADEVSPPLGLIMVQVKQQMRSVLVKLIQLLSKMTQMQQEMLMAGRVNSPRLVSAWMRPALCSQLQAHRAKRSRARPGSPAPTAVMLSEPRAVGSRLWGNLAALPQIPPHAQPGHQARVGGKCTERTPAFPLLPSPAGTEHPAPP